MSPVGYRMTPSLIGIISAETHARVCGNSAEGTRKPATAFVLPEDEPTLSHVSVRSYIAPMRRNSAFASQVLESDLTEHTLQFLYL
jgi:hypothetical protein